MILLSCIIPSIIFASVPGSCSAYIGTSLLVHHVFPWGFLFVSKIYEASGIVWVRWGSDRKAELKLVTNQLLEIISQTLEQTTQFH